MHNYDKEYETIRNFYGSHKAKRSGIPLMHHIEEGLELLNRWDRSNLEMAAFCLHPIVQNDEDVDVTWSEAYTLAVEYRDKANAYLCRPETDHITTICQLDNIIGDISTECMYMLLADKVQNQKDFQAHHMLTHQRSWQLLGYFNLWIQYLRYKLT